HRNPALLCYRVHPWRSRRKTRCAFGHCKGLDTSGHGVVAGVPRMSRMDRAAEYVLGLLDEEDRLLFESEMASDSELSRVVASLQSNFHALDDTAAPEGISDGLWEAISARIAQTPQAVPANSAAPDRS